MAVLAPLAVTSCLHHFGGRRSQTVGLYRRRMCIRRVASISLVAGEAATTGDIHKFIPVSYRRSCRTSPEPLCVVRSTFESPFPFIGQRIGLFPSFLHPSFSAPPLGLSGRDPRKGRLQQNCHPVVWCAHPPGKQGGHKVSECYRQESDQKFPFVEICRLVLPIAKGTRAEREPARVGLPRVHTPWGSCFT